MGLLEKFADHTVFSLELFPPKTDKGMEKLCGKGGVLDRLYELHPDYISCTYGAGGTNVGKNLEVLKKIKADGRTTPVTHLTCIGNKRGNIEEQLQSFLDNGIEDLLALRGDLPVGKDSTEGDFHYATELVKFIKERFGNRFTIGVAGSPEGHIACRSIEADISFLKRKQDNGADFITTQMCFDMEQFKRWIHAIREAGITLPVNVGVMPILDQAATVNMALSRNGCAIPRALSEIISRHWIFPNPFAPTEDEAIIKDKKEAFLEEGIAYTIRQIDEYHALGVNGIHLYALNKSEAVTRIAKEAGLIDFV
ncbi:MAG: methylenetetrahydrofolate reductase [Lachnospiraceae bacterium]|nr:methylenetetrahydrofolate reductase [Lachnospiraceae bacterium]